MVFFWQYVASQDVSNELKPHTGSKAVTGPGLFVDFGVTVIVCLFTSLLIYFIFQGMCDFEVTQRLAHSGFFRNRPVPFSGQSL